MAEARLQANTPDGNWAWSDILGTSHVEGSEFQTQTAGYLKSVAWYRPTVDNVKPAHLGVWHSNGTLVYSTDQVPDDGTVGWHTLQLTTTVPLAVGITYTIGGDYQAGTRPTRGSTAARGAAPSPLLWDDTDMRYGLAAWPNAPNTDYDFETLGVDATWTDSDPGVPGGGGSGSVDVQAALADWFDPLVATKPASNVKGYPLAMAELLQVPAGAALKILPRTWQGVAGLIATAADIVNIVTTIQGWLNGSGGGNASAVRAANGDTAVSLLYGIGLAQIDHTARLQTIEDAVEQLIQEHANAYAGVADFPTGWALLAETEWDEWIAWDQAAQLYVVNLTAYPPGRAYRTLGDVTWVPRAGWWTPLNGIQGTARAYFDLLPQQLHIGRATMPGILLVAGEGFTGTLQAWGAP